MPIYLPRLPETSEAELYINQLQNGLGVSRVMAGLLVNRGITDLQQAASFINPSLEGLHDPFLLPDMDSAVKRIQEAIKNDEHIVIYGDYDVDGVTAAALLYLFLKGRGADVEVYIPDRYSEGYGVNSQAVEHLLGRGTKLIITVDCGITAVEEVALAKRLGMDVIVTDHHRCSDTLPGAYAVVNPARSGHAYPFSGLAGVGVAAKLVQAMAGTETLWEYLDLVALGTVADIVPLVGENRILTAKGIQRINTSPRIGVGALIKAAGLAPGDIDASRIAFGLAPRLNAAGRMSTAYMGVLLLTTQDSQEAESIARDLNEENKKRQQIERDLVDECVDRLVNSGDLSAEWIIILDGEDWHPGVIGIAASKVTELFHRPCILISLQGETGVGSARSIEGFNIYNALKQAGDLFIRFGGHEMAAGFSIAREAVPELKQRLLGYACRNIDARLLVPRYYHDGFLAPQDITLSLIQEIKRLEPFGMGNPSPRFLFNNAEVESCLTVGNEGKHLKLSVSMGQRLWDAIGFGMGNKKDYLLGGRKKLDILAAVEQNEWNGVKKIQLNIKSMQAALGDRNDIDALLRPFYFKFFDAFLEGIMYNNDCTNKRSAEMERRTFRSVDGQEVMHCFKTSQLGSLILAGTPEGARWALSLMIDGQTQYAAFAYGYFRDMWETGMNGILLAPVMGRIPFRHYKRVFLLEGELPLYNCLHFMEDLRQKVYVIKGWSSSQPMVGDAFKRLNIERSHFVALYKWLHSRHAAQNLWPGEFKMLAQFNQATGQDINEFQLRLMLKVFEELGFVRIDNRQACVKVECVPNPRSRELTESVLYKQYKRWIQDLLSHCEKEE